MNTHLSILHLSKRVDRMENLMKELEQQNITDYTIVEGIIDLAAVFRGINNSHKAIIRLAKDQCMSNCIIAEDDISFLGKGAWKYFLEQLEINQDADIFLSMIYEGKIDENNRIVKDPYSWSSMTLYSVNSKFYDTFLSINDFSHIDKEIGSMADKYDFRVCNPFICKQMDGYSDQRKQHCTYDHLLVGRKLFGVNNSNPEVH